jgi:hypothetical protein
MSSSKLNILMKSSFPLAYKVVSSLGRVVLQAKSQQSLPMPKDEQSVTINKRSQISST